MYNMFSKKDNKKAAVVIPAFLGAILMIVGVLAIALWAMNTFGGGTKTGSLSVVQSAPAAQVAAGSNPVITIPAEDVTVTFSSWDFYAKGTQASTGHRILMFDGDIGIQVNDDATRQYSPSDEYKVLIGNLTTGLIGGTNYYPVYLTGKLGNSGTQTVAAGQYLAAAGGQLTFTFFDENDDTNAAQAIGANGEKKMAWKLIANDNVCVGNPDTGGLNIATYRYNNTVFSKSASISSSGVEQNIVTTPTGINATTGFTLVSYNFPVVCDNAEYKQKVLLKALNVDANGNDDINITLSDVSWDFDADTLEPIKGAVDEDNNDIGIGDYVVGSLRVS